MKFDNADYCCLVVELLFANKIKLSCASDSTVPNVRKNC